LLKDLLKKLIPGRTALLGDDSSPAPDARFGAQAGASGTAYTRHSHGLEQFLANIRTEEPLSVLELGGVTQENVQFVTDLGHRLYSEELLRSLNAVKEPEPDQASIDAFLDQNFGFPAGSFDGVLLWDTLEFLPPAFLKSTVDRLYHVSKPGAYLLAFFHADERAGMVPTYSYRIQDAGTLALVHRKMHRPEQLFNNRSVEKIFQRFQSVKFFLARDHLREVIVRR
jgi:hypothetical protein